MACKPAMENKIATCRFVDVFGADVVDVEHSYNTPQIDAKSLFDRKIVNGNLPFIVIEFPSDHRLAGQVDVPFEEFESEFQGTGKQSDLFQKIVSDESSGIIFNPIYLDRELAGPLEDLINRPRKVNPLRNCSQDTKALYYARIFNYRILKLYLEFRELDRSYGDSFNNP
jgi:hypothetical protein